jgi:hypothetical protein
MEEANATADGRSRRTSQKWIDPDGDVPSARRPQQPLLSFSES